MIRKLLTLAILVFTLGNNSLYASDMLMDPMPAAKPAPEFTLM